MVPASLSVRGVSLWANCNAVPVSLKRRERRRRSLYSFEGPRFYVVEHPAKASAGVARLLRRTYDAEHPAKASAGVARLFRRTVL